MEFQLNLQDLLITWLYIIIYPIESPLSPDKRVGKSHDSPTIYLCICNISFPITYPRFGWCTAKAYANFMKQIPYSSWWNRLFHYFWWLIPHFFLKIISCWSNSCVLYIYIPLLFWLPYCPWQHLWPFPRSGLTICASTRAPSTALDALDEQSFATAEMVPWRLAFMAWFFSKELRDTER